MYNLLAIILYCYITICNSNHISSLNNNFMSLMVKDYSVKENIYNDNIQDLSFNLDCFNHPKLTTTNKNIKNIVSTINIFFTKLFQNKDIHIEIMLLNRIIINATDQLLNMCNKMIEKTTSVLPMSYSHKFATDFSIYTQQGNNDNDNDDNDGNDNTINYKSSKLFNFLFVPKSSKQVTLLSDTALKQKIMDDMIAYQQYRDAINQRNLFLNSLCRNTFGSPYILYYNSANNTLNYAANTDAIKHYAIIIQNIIDNSHIRGLNYAFKAQKKLRDKDNKQHNKAYYSGLHYDIDLDIDIIKTESLIEKAKYIMPLLQKIQDQLSTYLYDISKRSLSLDEYFENLKLFWTNIGQEAYIGSQMYPLKYKEETLAIEKQKKEKEMEIQMELEMEIEKEKKAKLEALRIITEFKNKQLINDAVNYVREQEIILKDKKTNYSILEWNQFNRRIKQHMYGLSDSLVSGINGVLTSPKNFVIDFVTESILDLGKVAILALVLVYFVLFCIDKMKSFVFSIFCFSKNVIKEKNI